MGITVQLITNEVDELSERVGLGGVSTKESCLTTHTHIQNERTVPSYDAIRKLVCKLWILNYGTREYNFYSNKCPFKIYAHQ